MVYRFQTIKSYNEIQKAIAVISFASEHLKQSEQTNANFLKACLFSSR